jgi:hypothetical protein
MECPKPGAIAMSAFTLKDFARAVRMAAALALLAAVGACAWADPNTQYPETGGKGNRGGHAGGYQDIGSVFGPGGLSLGGSEGPLEPGQSGPGIGVNSFLWRASLDTMSFMPLASADPFGGVIITDWYSPPEAPAERFKVTVYILGRELRADGLRASVFRQTQDTAGTWVDSGVEPQTGAELENAILVRARQLRIAGLQ